MTDFEYLDPYTDAQHKEMDAYIMRMCPQLHEANCAVLLMIIVQYCEVAPGKRDHFDRKFEALKNAVKLLGSHPDIKRLLEEAHNKGSFKRIRNLAELRIVTAGQSEYHKYYKAGLGEDVVKAYSTPFLGTAASNFINHLDVIDKQIRQGDLQVYAKAISVVQSSGTGKSRMLTEVGSKVFTLPICLRNPTSPGYPPSDPDIFKYFEKLSQDNDLSLSAHAAVACFLGSALENMLEVLKAQHFKDQKTELLPWWHAMMENKDSGDARKMFYEKVVKNAESKKTVNKQTSSPRSRDGTGVTPTSVTDAAKNLHRDCVEKPLEELMSFLQAAMSDKNVIVIVYIDEAQEMGLLFWVLLRLLERQTQHRIFYVFMRTKSTVSYFAPTVDKVSSLRLKGELSRLIPPYFAVGFDQHITQKAKSGETIVKIGELHTLAHLCNYGRPLWYANQSSKDIVGLAGWKLTNTKPFDAKSRNLVFAILSQRLCLEPVLANAEANELAERTVADHMRLITGISHDRRIFYTRTPSEPILALAAAQLFYERPENEQKTVLETLTTGLHEPGLIERGLAGELAARILLLFARDLAQGIPQRGACLLRPTPVSTFFQTLLGPKWGGEHQKEFEDNFKNAHVNFTHWVVTGSALPTDPDETLLANLWARGAALQCTFNQEAVDIMIVHYHGSIEESAIFDPSLLSATYGQIKLKSAADTTAEARITPFGLVRNISGPLPYIALLMELGTEANFQSNREKVALKLPDPNTKGKYSTLVNDWITAKGNLEASENKQIPGRKKRKRADDNLEQAVNIARSAMESYNRFAISVRGASPDVYSILKTAKMSEQFAALLKVTLPQPTPESAQLAAMYPFGFPYPSAATNWMVQYSRGPASGDEEMDSV